MAQSTLKWLVLLFLSKCIYKSKYNVGDINFGINLCHNSPHDELWLIRVYLYMICWHNLTNHNLPCDVLWHKIMSKLVSQQALLVNQIREETGVWTPPPELMIYPLGGPSSHKRCGTHGWAHYLLQVERGLFLKGNFSPPLYEHFRLVSKACCKIPIWLGILRIYFSFWGLWIIQNRKHFIFLFFYWVS